jgi:hypothetical protein
MTSTLRFEGVMNLDIATMYTELVTAPSIHFMFASYGPLVLADKKY